MSAKKNPFRHFSRDVAANAAYTMKIDLASISGKARAAHKGTYMRFDTPAIYDDPLAYFAEAMSTELEHGRAGDREGTNVTDDDASLTSKIVAAHLLGVERDKRRPYRPFPAYYDALWWNERMFDLSMNR